VWEETVDESETRVRELTEAKAKLEADLTTLRLNGPESVAHYKSLSIEQEECNAKLAQAWHPSVTIEHSHATTDTHARARKMHSRHALRSLLRSGSRLCVCARPRVGLRGVMYVSVCV
jgi:regulator of replication initiation timing